MCNGSAPIDHRRNAQLFGRKAKRGFERARSLTDAASRPRGGGTNVDMLAADGVVKGEAARVEHEARRVKAAV